MIPTKEVGLLVFKFSASCVAAQIDEWSYYRNQFRQLGNNVRMACSECSEELVCAGCGTAKNAGIKACDLVALESGTLWMIEVKDYRRHQRKKAIKLPDEIALKVRDSMAVLFGASLNANEAIEREVSLQAVKCTRMRVILHLEQTTTPSRLFPRTIKPADVLQRLKQLLKAIDPHPEVVEIAKMRNLPWSVTSKGTNPEPSA